MKIPKLRRLTSFQLNTWLDDNGISQIKLATLTGYHLRGSAQMCARRPVKGRRHPPARMTAILTLLHRDMTRDSRTALLCRCGCGEYTHRSHLTGCFNLYLPDHSKMSKFRKSIREGMARKAGQTIKPLTDCTECFQPLKRAMVISKKGKKKRAARVCAKCGFKQDLDPI